MCRKLILIVLIAWLCTATAISIDMMRQAKKDVGYRNMEPRRSSSSYYYERSRSTTTTERPIVRYWNNLMRNVRLPVPTITWNMTNPLVNLFNAGETNVMETPVANYHTTAGGSDRNRKRKNTRKHTNSNPTHKHSKNRKRKHNYEQQVDLAEQDDDLTLQPYSNEFDPNKAMFFYDPGTNQYYEVQRLNSQNDNDKRNHINSKDSYNDDGNMADVSQSEEQTSAATQSQEENHNDLEASDLIKAANEMSTDDIEKMRLDMLNSKRDDDDDDVAVVSKLDDDEETLQVATDMKITTNKNDEEMLRNALGSYMSDDRLNRKKQRASGKRNRVKNVGRPRPRDSYRFYYLQGW